MTILWRADGIGSTSNPSHPHEDHVMSLGTHLTRALRSAIGKHVEIRLSAHSLEFLLTSVAQRYPEVIRAMAAELEDYEPSPPGHYDMDHLGRSTRLQEAVLRGLSRYIKEDS
jgi:hypothetical protein